MKVLDVFMQRQEPEVVRSIVGHCSWVSGTQLRDTSLLITGLSNSQGIQFSAGATRCWNPNLKAYVERVRRTHNTSQQSEDLVKLRESPFMSPNTPDRLLRKVWFNVTLYWCCRGCEGQCLLWRDSFVFGKDADLYTGSK